jgi:hypothetical protein
MFNILVDTCVWLDTAKDPDQQPLLGVLEELVKLNEVRLIVPRIVIDEFGRNKQRIIQESGTAYTPDKSEADIHCPDLGCDGAVRLAVRIQDARIVAYGVLNPA